MGQAMHDDMSIGQQRPKLPPSPLSPRETEILELVAHGRDVPHIARVLAISPHTVRNHTRVTHAKLGVHTKAHAVAVALRNRWIA